MRYTIFEHESIVCFLCFAHAKEVILSATISLFGCPYLNYMDRGVACVGVPTNGCKSAQQAWLTGNMDETHVQKPDSQDVGKD